MECNHDGVPDDIDNFLLSVSANGFAGRVETLIQWVELIQLAEKLDVFPIPTAEPAILDLRYGVEDNCESTAVLQFSSTGAAGPVMVTVAIAEEHDSGFAVKCKFGIDYPQLERFRDELILMAKRQSGSICIEGLMA